MYGDVANLEKAMEEAIPDRRELKKLEKQKSYLEKRETTINNSINRIVTSISKGTITDDEAKGRLDQLRVQKEELATELDTINGILSSVPSAEVRNRKAHLTRLMIKRYSGLHSRISTMPFDDKKKLFQTAFGGKGSSDKRLGVYLRQSFDKKQERIHYDIRGILSETQSQLPMDLAEVAYIFGIDTDESGYYDPIDNTKEDENRVIGQKNTKKGKKGKLDNLSDFHHFTPNTFYINYFTYCNHIKS